MGIDLMISLRILQGLLALTVLATSAYVVEWYFRATRFAAPSEFTFLIFAPTWTLVSLAYLELTPRFVPRASHPYAALAFEFLNTIFYFAGFIALAVFLGRVVFCRGAECIAARIAVVAASVEFVLWSVTFGLMAKYVFKGGLQRKPSPYAVQARPPMREAESA
ncbi:hypothetical protein SODALDRAFT_348504 [Sodiomyces alkalinus F11]|uniref:MARVEL domain-containing protein n=1 Tax=Sodiomyces alkalinus (strain CBS 110278 / VKM F-3762 / F11) TaxID=1314773 RepID=A0A3N2Q0C7_SODAK|nr:hypothetical protein SODALDRAFT_348504 [Sodiomyces alkalinus F11]ROT40213.1 hypothetical protein SODALDRAFT_348504 [Sodiomyces alkalinus F11]